MNLAHIKQVMGNIEASMSDDPLAVWGLIIGGLLAGLVFGGLLLHAYLDKKRERQKAEAVERLLKHLKSLPGQKS
jgi:hypothetical protein